MLAANQNSGFYFAPVSKSLLGILCISSIAVNFSLPKYTQWFTYNAQELWNDQKVIPSLLLTRTIFLDTKDLLCACMLFYNFRVFERRYGSRKFFSLLCLTGMMSILLEMLAVHVAELCSIELTDIPSGPYGVVFALFVPYFTEIPRVTATHVLGVPMTGKSLIYIIGLQMASSSLETFMLACCGLVSGILYKRLSFLSILTVPPCIGTVCDRTVGRLVASAPPPDQATPMGATLQLQRTQQMERLEQQVLMAQLGAARRQPNMMGFGMMANRNQQAANPDIPAPTEDQINQLLDMGFSRERVMSALRRSNNDTTMATTLLIDES